MEFGDYIRAIASTKLFIGSQENIVIKLFKNSEAITPVEDNSAKAWIKPENSSGYRKCRIRDYFPQDTVYEIGFIKFFRNRVGNSWKILQKAFNQINNDCIINLETNNPDIFYWSLLNQFQKIHRLPLSEMPAKEMIKLFKNAVEECKLAVFFENHAEISDFQDSIKKFLKILNDDIIIPYNSGYPCETLMYKNILKLSKEIEYIVIGYSLEGNNLLSYYRFYHDSIQHCRQQIYDLYCEICDIDPQYEYKTLGSFSFESELQTDIKYTTKKDKA